VFGTFRSVDGGQTWSVDDQSHSFQPLNPDAAIFAASNSSMRVHNGARVFITGGPSANLFVEITSPSAGQRPYIVIRQQMAEGDTAGGFSFASAEGGVGVVLGGDYSMPNEASHTAAYSVDGRFLQWHPAQTRPHGFRSAVAYSPDHKTWITVGPNGTDISTDDGRNWRALKPSPGDASDADKNWNALSLPYAVGPHGRIGKLRPTALQPQP
jgi:hypothetical protein